MVECDIMTTQYAEASYQEIIDLHTESDTVSVVGIHTPQGANPRKMLRGFFTQFKRFKYDGCSLSLVPAARLPADPSQVSYGAGEPPIDPRDMLNPILWHGCHGNDLGTILNQFYSGQNGSTDFITRYATDSVNFDILDESRVGTDQMIEALYYKALTDNTWAKAHPQRGFRKSGLKPMVYSLATNYQFASSTGASTSYGFSQPYSVYQPTTGQPSSQPNDQFGFGSSQVGPSVMQTPNLPSYVDDGEGTLGWTRGASRQSIQFFTPRLERLGWLDTYSVVGNGNAVTQDAVLTGSVGPDRQAVANTVAFSEQYGLREVQLPRIFMGMLLLPPAYKTEQYFRMVINHHFSFSKFRGTSAMNDNAYEVNNDYTYTNLN